MDLEKKHFFVLGGILIVSIFSYGVFSYISKHFFISEDTNIETQVAQVSGINPNSVPSPFLPLSRTGLTISLWNRMFRFGNNPVPVSIISNNRELLTRTPFWNLPEGVLWGTPQVLSESSKEIILETLGSSGNLNLKAQTKVTYYGGIFVDLEISATSSVQITDYSYGFYINPSASDRFLKHLPYSFPNKNVDSMSLVEQAGEWPRLYSSQHEFVPTFAFLGDTVGLEWWADTDGKWTPFDKDTPTIVKPLEIGDGGIDHFFKVTPIQIEPVTVASGSPWKDSFSLFVLPMRAETPNWRSIRFSSKAQQNVRNDINTRFCEVLFNVGGFVPEYGGLPKAILSSDFYIMKNWYDSPIQYCRIHYGALTATPALHPTAFANLPEWDANGTRFMGIFQNFYDYAHQRYRVYTGELFDKYNIKWGQYFACGKEYYDFMLRENISTLIDSEQGVGGLYFDHASGQRMCEKSTLINPGTSQNPTRQQMWDYKNLLYFYETLFEAKQNQASGKIIVSHWHGAPRALEAFVDVTAFGESLNLFFDKDSAPGWQSNVSTYKPDYHTVPDVWIKAHTKPHIGGISFLLPQIKPALDSEESMYQKKFYGWALEQDLPFWYGNLGNVPTYSKFVVSFERFGSIRNDHIRVYRGRLGEGVQSSHSGVFGTVYSRIGGPGYKGLLVVSNENEGEVNNVTITLDKSSLELSSVNVFDDAENTNKVTDLWSPLLGGNKVSGIIIPGGEYKMYLLDYSASVPTITEPDPNILSPEYPTLPEFIIPTTISLETDINIDLNERASAIKSKPEKELETATTTEQKEKPKAIPKAKAFDFSKLTGPLSLGARGEQVKLLQEILKSDETLYPERKVTGYYGILTRKAIERFQKKYGIAKEGDRGFGITGPKTRAKLREVFGGEELSATSTQTKIDNAVLIEALKKQILELQLRVLDLLKQLLQNTKQ
jgi:hypothetical protein